MYTYEIDKPTPLGNGSDRKGGYFMVEGLYISFLHPLVVYQEYNYRSGYDLCVISSWEENPIEECDYEKGIFLVETRGEKRVERFVLCSIAHFDQPDDYQIFLNGYMYAMNKMGEIA